MSDKPIIFSAPMVRALLEGRKTQTRRVLKPQPEVAENGSWLWITPRVRSGGSHWTSFPDVAAEWCSYAPGDRLYVREAFWLCEECGHRNMCADGANYSGFPDRGCCVSCDALLPRAKTSPIHMPRWASRLTLTITDVRVQRLQEISEADAVAEGLVKTVAPNGHVTYQVPDLCGGQTPARAFHMLWDSLHDTEAWDANPWVAAYSFTVQHGTIDMLAERAAQ